MPELRADCSSCAGLCCVALSLTRSTDFPVDKPAGEPCQHLQNDCRCGIHDRLRERGYRGCTVYDCFGAGQQVTRAFGGADWRSGPAVAGQMFAVFHVVRQLHELLWLLEAAIALPAAAPVRDELVATSADTVALTHLEPDRLAAYDVEPHRHRVNVLLRRVSRLARAGLPGPDPADADPAGADLAGADLAGCDLRATPLTGASLRGALLTGADLRGVDLTAADVTGADLRGADLTGADLTRALFLTQAQVDSARGGTTTRLPATHAHPAWWPDR